jgi:transposase
MEEELLIDTLVRTFYVFAGVKARLRDTTNNLYNVVNRCSDCGTTLFGPEELGACTL